MENAIPYFESELVTDTTRAVTRYHAAVMYLELQDEDPVAASKWLKDSELESVEEENSMPSPVLAAKAYLDFVGPILLEAMAIMFVNYNYDSSSPEVQQRFDNLHLQLRPYAPKFHRDGIDDLSYRNFWIHEPFDGFDMQAGLNKSARLLKYCD